MKIKMNPKLVVLIGALGISISPILIKLSNSEALTIAFYRLLFTILILTPFVIRKNKNEILSLSKKNIRNIAFSGFFLGIHFSLWILSLKYTTVASATVLVNTSPIILLLVTYFVLKEKTNKKQILAIFFAFVGSIILAYGDFFNGTNAILGDIFAVLGAFFVSIYLLIGNKVRQDVSMGTYTFLTYSFATITIFICNLFVKHSLVITDKSEYILFLAMAIFPTLLGHSLFSWSLKYVKPTLISMAILAEPVIASIIAIFIFYEVPTINQILGAIIIIGSIYHYTKNK